MSVSIGVGDAAGSQLWPVEAEPSLWLDSDGYYWYLHPLFEKLRDETGEYVDLYGDAWFDGDNLEAFQRMLEQARNLVSQEPESWQVHTGTQIQPEHKELYAEVTKERFLELLSSLNKIANRAKELGRRVVCFGD
ncbi:MAG TPA: hypothetical protein VGZ47_19505 [Gemmataceae bacterium]|jgi:hypothetical protein|nr:hypothetical protein [Gemmataceae bacterium]